MSSLLLRCLGPADEVIRIAPDTLIERPKINWAATAKPDPLLWSLVATRIDGSEHILCQAEGELDVMRLYNAGQFAAFSPGVGSHLTSHLARQIDVRAPGGAITKIIKQKP